MKTYYNNIYSSFLACTLALSIVSCKDDTLIFPKQIAAEDSNPSGDRGPVKQNSFSVIAVDDELIKFDLSNVDIEKVKSLFFSYNANGEEVNTEIIDFNDLYIIKNLPLRAVSQVKVWAIGYNGLESQKYSYAVVPLPYASTLVAENISIDGKVNAATLSIFNLSRSGTTLFYKVNDAIEFTSVDVPSPTSTMEIDLVNLPKGDHTITYYVTDQNGGKTKEFTRSFVTYGLSKIPNQELVAEVSSTESNEGAGNGIGASLTDGNINTYWHSSYSSANPIFPHWIVLDLGVERLFAGLEMIRRHNNAYGGFKTFTVEYSSDKRSWNVLENDLTFNSSDSPAAFQRYLFNVVKTRYIRIYIKTPATAGVTNTHLAEVNIFEAK